MVGFITPLTITGWNSVLFVHPGDYYTLRYTNVYKAMETCSTVTAQVYYSDYPFNNPSTHCDSTYFATIGDSPTPLYQNYSIKLWYYSDKENILWVPRNTTITGLKNINALC